MRGLTMTVKGLGALLTHNPASMRPAGKMNKGSKVPEPDVEAEGGTYMDDDGRYCIPAAAFRGAIIKASASFKMGRKSGKYFTSHIEMDPANELVPLTDAHGKPLNYTIDTRRAVIQRQGILRSRPKFRDWHAEFTFFYDEGIVTEATAANVFLDFASDAGRRIGVGDFRPERGGWFGRFEVTDVAAIPWP